MGKKSAAKRAAETRQVVAPDVKQEAKSVAAAQAQTFEKKLALAQSLQASIERRIRHLNRPVAMFVSAITMPSIVGILFLHEQSPLHIYHQQFHQSYFNYFYKKTYQKYEQIFAGSSLNYLEKTCEMFKDLLQKYIAGIREGAESQGKIIHPSPLQFVTELGAININKDNVTPKTEYILEVKEGLKLTMSGVIETFANQQDFIKLRGETKKENLVEHITQKFSQLTPVELYTWSLIDQAKGRQRNGTLPNSMSKEDNIRRVTQKYSHLSIVETYERAEEECQQYNAVMTGINQGITKNISRFSAEHQAVVQMDRLLVATKIGVAMLAQHFFVEPLVAKRFPNGIFQIPPPRVELLPTTTDEADSYIALLKDHDAKLAQVEGRNINYARYSSLAIVSGAIFDLPFMVRLLSVNERLPIELVVIFCIGLIATGSINLLKDLYDLYENYNFEKVFARQETALKTILGKTAFTLTPVNRENLEASCFIVQFERKNELSPDTLARILKNIFKHRGVAASLRYGSALIIPADCDLNGVGQLFAAGIKKELAIIELQQQVKALLNACFIDATAYSFMPSMSGFDGLPTATFEFNLPFVAKDFREKLIELFAENEIDVEVKDNRVSIIIEGHSCADEEALTTLCAQLKGAVQKVAREQQAAEPAPRAPSEAEMDDKTAGPEPAVRQRTKKASDDAQDDKFAVIPKQVEPHREFTWIKDHKRFTYNSGRDDNTIFPLRTGQFHNFRSVANTWHFVRNALDADMKPMTPELYQAFDDQVKAPILVSPEAKQGFVFWKGKGKTAKDQKTNASFPTSLKLKVLGEQGDNRGFTDEQTAAEGRAVLHTLRAFKLGTH